MFVSFFRKKILRSKRGIGGIGNIFDLKVFLKAAIDQTKPRDITKFSTFDILKPESKTIKIIEKLAVLAAIAEVIAVITKFADFPHYEVLIYGALYGSVIVTIFLPVAKFFDSVFAYRKLLKNLRDNPLDRALMLSFLLGAGSIIGPKKMLELKNDKCGWCISLLNQMQNFWDNTRIHGNFVNEFEDIFGKGSFSIFIDKIAGLDERLLDIDEMHEVISPFFDNALLWENKKVFQIVRLLNYKSSGIKSTDNKAIITSIDYLLLTYFKYGKTDIIHDIERFYVKV